MWLAVSKALTSDKEERLLPSPPALWSEVIRRLLLIDAETFDFERRRIEDHFLAQLEEVDRNETLKFDGFVHGQSIILQSALITILRCRRLSSGTSLIDLSHAIDRGRAVTAEDRERLQRWYVNLLFGVHRLIPSLGWSESGSDAPAEGKEATAGSVARLLTPESSSCALREIVEHRQSHARKAFRSSVHMGPAAQSKSRTLMTMADACSPLTLPFFVDGDLVHVVLNALPLPSRPRRKALLKPDSVRTLVRLARESWFAAWKRVAQRASVENVVGDVSPKRFNSIDDRLNADRSVLESYSSSYSKFTEDPVVVAETLMNMDFSFLDSFYRRLR
jgi:hypothetical protein